MRGPARSKGEGKGAAGPAAGRRERNKREKLERIVAATRHLFRTKGFEATTTQEIAEAADIGTGTLFLYATSKEDLLVVVFTGEMIAVAREAFQDLDRAAPLLDQLMVVFGRMIAYHARDLALTRALLKELTALTNPNRRRDVAALMHVIFGGIVDMVLAAQVSGAIRRDVAPLHAAQYLFATYYPMLLYWVGGYLTEGKLPERLRHNLRMALDGLAARPPDLNGNEIWA